MFDRELEIQRLRNELEDCKRELERYRTWVPPGHMLSPIPSREQVKLRERQIYAVPREMPGLDLNEEGQLRLFDQLRVFYKDQPFSAQKTAVRRYWFENPAYSYADAILLYCMMRYLRPHRVVEIGAGYSSCAILDTNELFFENSIDCTFIEPAPELLRSLLTKQDQERITIVEKQVQEVDSQIFTALQANDVLFIDSSHVAKVRSQA